MGIKASKKVEKEYNTAIVIDIGSGLCKAGLSGEATPRCTFPSIVGYPRSSDNRDRELDVNKELIVVGFEAEQNANALTLSYPVSHGIIQNWKDMEKIWHHTFYNQLRVDPSEHPVLLIEPILNPKKNRERMLNTIFTQFGVPAMQITLEAVLACFAVALTTGVVLDVGDGVTSSVPIYEGYVIPHAFHKTDLAGRDLNEYLCKMLVESGYTLNPSKNQNIIRDIKEKCCYVALDYEKEVSKYENGVDNGINYKLQDDSLITLEMEAFKCPEALFQPSLIGKDNIPVHEVLVKTIMNVEKDLLESLFENVILSGGSVCFKGFAERMKLEIEMLAPASVAVNVIDSSKTDKKYAAWIGGSILSSLSAYKGEWISNEDFCEKGAKGVVNKCLSELLNEKVKELGLT